MLRRSHVLRNAGIAVAAGRLRDFLPASTATCASMWLIGLGTTASSWRSWGSRADVRRVRASLDAEGVHVGGRVIARAHARSGRAGVERSYRGKSRAPRPRPLADVELEAADDAEAATSFARWLRPVADRRSSSPRSIAFCLRLAGATGGQLCAHELLRARRPPLAALGTCCRSRFASSGSLLLFVFGAPRDVGRLRRRPRLRASFAAGSSRSRRSTTAVVESAGKLVVRTRTARQGRVPDARRPPPRRPPSSIQSAITSSAQRLRGGPPAAPARTGERRRRGRVARPTAFARVPASRIARPRSEATRSGAWSTIRAPPGPSARRPRSSSGPWPRRPSALAFATQPRAWRPLGCASRSSAWPTRGRKGRGEGRAGARSPMDEPSARESVAASADIQHPAGTPTLARRRGVLTVFDNGVSACRSHIGSEGILLRRSAGSARMRAPGKRPCLQLPLQGSVRH